MLLIRSAMKIGLLEYQTKLHKQKHVHVSNVVKGIILLAVFFNE